MRRKREGKGGGKKRKEGKGENGMDWEEGKRWSRRRGRGGK